jgi:phage terminase large subunit GpA-like protein
MPAEAVDEHEWLAQGWDAVTTKLEVLRPSEWAERHRYLPASSSPRPGPYRYKVAPYLREIIDCLSVDSPIREVSFQKGVQIGATVGVLENFVGYLIAFVKKSPAMLLTADAELASTRLNTSLIPMFQLSELDQFVRSSDERNSRKTGRTEQRIEWDGGGFLLLNGVKNPDKLRSIPVENLLRDEVDSYPMTVGKDGDPMALSTARTAAYERTRKILNISTPTIRGQSKIEDCFRRGDQRRYFVRCLKCNAPQTLRWSRTNKETGEVTGFVWETQDGALVPGSVRYLCKECGHPHSDDDKPRLMAPEHGAAWLPTHVSPDPFHRSYHLPALYSLLQTWGTAAAAYLDAWDVARAQPRDVNKLQVFYNNQLGESFRIYGSSVRFESVSGHRRFEYQRGQVPNKWASKHCGSAVLVIVCTVDVHKDNLAVSVWGWCRGRRAILVDYERYTGDTEDLQDAATWGRLATLIDSKEYAADDGKTYPITASLIDSGYRADDVYTFCKDHVATYPVKGRDAPPRSANLKEFSEFTTPMGTTAYGITVDFYKDRWSSALRRLWGEDGIQPEGHFNAFSEITDKQLKELTVETKREKVDKQTGQRLGFMWHRPSGADNELWDCLVYASAALDILAWSTCTNELGLEAVNWTAFFDVCESHTPFFTESNVVRG